MARTRSSQSSSVGPEPALEPPADAAVSTAASTSAPTDLPPDASLTSGAVSTGDTGPSAMPPESGQQAIGASTWLTDKRITALWSINQNRNSWIHVAGVGWRRLATNSDSAIVAMSMISAHARQMQSSVTLRQEADGLIHEIYAW